MTILTENDWKAVQNALQRMEHIELERTLVPKNVRVVVTTEPVDKPWNVAMIVTVKAWHRCGNWFQHFESVEAARRALRDWNGYGKML